jgi:hypothetical protein
MFKIGSLYYWFNHGRSTPRRGAKKCTCGKPIANCDGWHGPKATTVVMLDGTFIEMDFTNYNDMNKIKGINAELVAGTITRVPADNRWSGEYGKTYSLSCGYMSGEANETKEEFAARLLKAQADDEAEEAAIKADPAKELERLLTNRDWYYHYSDDHSVWLGGEATTRRMMALIEKVPADKVKELWGTCKVPEDIKCPV